MRQCVPVIFQKQELGRQTTHDGMNLTLGEKAENTHKIHRKGERHVLFKPPSCTYVFIKYQSNTKGNDLILQELKLSRR